MWTAGTVSPVLPIPVNSRMLGEFTQPVKLQIWQEMMERGYERIIVFEDDIRFYHFLRLE